MPRSVTAKVTARLRSLSAHLGGGFGIAGLIRRVDVGAVAPELGKTCVIEQHQHDVGCLAARMRRIVESVLGVGDRTTDRALETRWPAHVAAPSVWAGGLDASRIGVASSGGFLSGSSWSISTLIVLRAERSRCGERPGETSESRWGG